MNEVNKVEQIIIFIIAIFIVAFVVLFGIFVFIEDKIKHKLKRPVKIIQNGISVVLSYEEYQEYLDKKRKESEKLKQQEELEKQKAITAFSNKCSELNSKIENTANSCDDVIKKKVLIEILKIETKSESDYELKLWLFNDGKLQTNEEVSKRETEIYNAKHRDTFDGDRLVTTFVSALIGFVLTFVSIILAFPNLEELRFVIGVWLGLLGALIGSAIGHTVNIANAEQYGISSTDPRVQKERIARGVDIASAAIGTVSVGKKAKSAIKEIGNPDSWQEMK